MIFLNSLWYERIFSDSRDLVSGIIHKKLYYFSSERFNQKIWHFIAFRAKRHGTKQLELGD